MSSSIAENTPKLWLLGVVSVFLSFVHLAVIYLGIVALVCVMAIFTLPDAREQARLVRSAVISVLVPEERLLSNQDLLQVFGMAENREMQTPPSEAEAELVANPEVNVSQDRGFFDDLNSNTQFTIKGVPNDKALALREYIARKFKVARNVTGALIHVVYQEAEAKQLDPLLVLGVIAIESRYNPFAESSVGAQGLMQVLTRVHTDKFIPISSSELVALNPIANIRVGTQILHDCIKRRGSVDAGLSCYVGATGPNDGGYADKVQAERKRIALESRIALKLNLGKYR